MLTHAVSFLRRFITNEKPSPKPFTSRFSVMPNEPKGVILIGMIHGIGAESPTQVLALIAAASTGEANVGIALLIVFLLGMCISNLLVAGISVCGYTKLRNHMQIYRSLGMVTAALSFGVGVAFLLGLSEHLPQLCGV